MISGNTDKKPGALAFLHEIWGYARPYRGRSALCALATAIRAAFLLILPLFYQQIFDRVLGPDGSVDLLGPLVGLMVLAFIVIILADLAMAWLGSDLAARIMGDLRRRMYLHLQGLSETFYSRTQIGDLTSRFTNDLFSVDWAMTPTRIYPSCRAEGTGGPIHT
jgi:ATP-binding cassette subfamily B protein